MRYDQPVYLSSPAVHLGERTDSAEDAVAAGRVTRKTADRYGYRSLPVSDLAAVELAERAAAAALRQAGLTGADLDRLLHAWTYHQGHEFWSPAHYVADRLDAGRAVPLGIQQMCNGSMAALEVAARELVADPAVHCSLVTTGDRFADAGFDRWGDFGVAYGDGATAVLVCRSPRGRAVRLLASAATAASALEGMHRGSEPFSPAAGSHRPLRPEHTKRQFLKLRPDADFGKLATAAVGALIRSVLDQAGIDGDDPGLVAVALPRLADHVLDDVYAPAARAACAAPVVDLGRETGHLGAGDPIANLADLLAARRARPGQRMVLLGAGAGFTWSAAVVEVVQ